MGKCVVDGSPNRMSDPIDVMGRDRGYHPCEQGYTRADTINAQVVKALKHLKIPAGLTKRIQRAVENSSDNAEAITQIENLKERLERIDLSWDEGFLTPQEYVGKRKSVQAEIDALRPLQYDNLEEAADILNHFAQYWSACKEIEAPEEARQQLLAKIVDRVFVYDDVVVGIALYSDYSVVLNADTLYMSHISGKIQEVVETETGNRLVARTPSGSDGIRIRREYHPNPRLIFAFPELSEIPLSHYISDSKQTQYLKSVLIAVNQHLFLSTQLSAIQYFQHTKILNHQADHECSQQCVFPIVEVRLLQSELAYH